MNPILAMLGLDVDLSKPTDRLYTLRAAISEIKELADGIGKMFDERDLDEDKKVLATLDVKREGRSMTITLSPYTHIITCDDELSSS